MRNGKTEKLLKDRSQESIKRGMMKHLNKIFVIKIIIYIFLLMIIIILMLQTTQNSLPNTVITLENTTILGKILGIR